MSNKPKLHLPDTWLTLSIIGLYSIIQAFTLLRIYAMLQLDEMEINWPELLQDRLAIGSVRVGGLMAGKKNAKLKTIP